MKRRVITVFPGDGIGPEVMTSTLQVLEATGLPFEWDRQVLGEMVADKTTDYAKEFRVAYAAERSLDMHRVALKGPTATPVGEGHRSLNVGLRQKFRLFANVRPIRSMPGVRTRFSDVPIDMVIFRENLEDLYVGEEESTHDESWAIARFTHDGCVNIARYAFRYARAHGRRKITIVHKANILKETHGRFLEIAQDIAKEEAPDMEVNDLIADNCMMQLVRNPEKFDCLLAPNFLGDLLSDLAAGLIGGLGFAPGANIGESHAVFEAVHGTAPDIAGKGIANPTAMILSAAMMLDHIGYPAEAVRVRQAVETVLREGRCITKDVNPEKGVSTEEYARAVIAAL